MVLSFLTLLGVHRREVVCGAIRNFFRWCIKDQGSSHVLFGNFWLLMGLLVVLGHADSSGFWKM